MAERRSVIQIFTVLSVYLRVTVHVKFMPRKIRAMGAACNTSKNICYNIVLLICMNLLVIGMRVSL